MNKQALKGLVLTLKAVVEQLESEVYSDVSSYNIDAKEEEVFLNYEDVGEDDGYLD
jgi:hypothetical protein